MPYARVALFLLSIPFFLLPLIMSAAASPISPGTIHTDPTQIHMGIRWQVDGDTNLDATCRVRFRRQGSAQWRAGLNLMRTHPNLHGLAGKRHPLGTGYRSARQRQHHRSQPGLKFR